MRELNIKIDGLEERRTEIILKLGEYYYSTMRNIKDIDINLDDIKNEIISIDKELYRNRKEIARIMSDKEKLTCVSCGDELTREDRFCKGCGEKVEVEVVKEEVGNCSQCGTIRYEGENFCGCCGVNF